ncbi:alcohol dehydrogenase catalytic domain-containing protein [Hymenobacter arizonensis]|uniref:alcohol dehydrogenase catalytic domain-containing protein n=1 Tax=Hymenobacter arizonensis TaxID=1227077 RepID=UPI000B85EAE2|nr:alcohol dehydrogenase catalytic domain-containing protein [Hymenobacter arizonensis]
MKAILAEHGQLWYRDTPAPTVGPADVLIHVHAAGVNPDDLTLAEAAALPRIAGQEVAGLVAGTGPQVRGWHVGDAVCALICPSVLGAFAEWVCVLASAVAALPAGLSFSEGATLPLAGLWAWQGLFTQGGLRSGQRVLVHGAAGAWAAWRCSWP